MTQAPSQLTCPVGHTFPFEQLTIRDGLSVCPICEQSRWVRPRSTWTRTLLAHPLLLLVGALVMFFVETIGGIGIGVTYANQHVAGAGWLTAGSIVSLAGVAVVVAGIVRLVVALHSATFTRSLLVAPLVVSAIGVGLLAAGDLVQLGLNVAFVNASQPGAGWELFSQVFDTLFFAGMAGALAWAAAELRRPDPAPPATAATP